MKDYQILIVDDNKSALSALKMFLQLEFQKVETTQTPNQLPTLLHKNEYDVILLDMNFSAGINTGNEGLYWLKEIKKTAPSTEVVMITAYGDVELAVKALKLGASDFILKPWENEKLLATIKSACRLRDSNKKINELTSREKVLKKEFNNNQKLIIGESPQIMSMMRLISKVAQTGANVLITGENGTGKELIAREIHQQSNRSNELMVSVDMGAIPDTLFESELFGHKKGAFTDAREERVGKFQLADKGTLFLDEIGNLPLPMQSKLLTVLQNRRVIPIGSNKEINIDIRLITATNCMIDQMIANQQFREDLLYRLNTIHIEVPPLRARGEDIEILATFFLKKFEKKYKKGSLKISTHAVKKLMKYAWPGNVRELQHTIEKAVILAESPLLKPEDFNLKSTSKFPEREPEKLEDMERRMIDVALDAHNGNFSAAANQLGITRQTLYNKIKKYEL